MFRTILLSALGAGLAACVAITAVQTFTTEPLILDTAAASALGRVLIASLVASAVLWSLSGAAVGWLHQRLARAR